MHAFDLAFEHIEHGLHERIVLDFFGSRPAELRTRWRRVGLLRCRRWGSLLGAGGAGVGAASGSGTTRRFPEGGGSLNPGTIALLGAAGGVSLKLGDAGGAGCDCTRADDALTLFLTRVFLAGTRSRPL